MSRNFPLLPKSNETTRSAHRSGFRIGGVSVQITGSSAGDISFVPSLSAFRCDVGDSDIDVEIAWVNELPFVAERPAFDSGSVWRLYEKHDELQFDFQAAVFGDRPYKNLTVDSRFRRATVQMSKASFANSPNLPEPLEYPLDELLIVHRLTQENAIELHGCGIVTREGSGSLFVGHSGAGKSTTTRLWMALQDVDILSDDRIIVRRDPECKAASEILMYGTPWHGEAKFASPSNAPLKRIFVLEHGHGNVLTRLSSSQAVGELLARAFVPFHRHEYLDSALGFLQELVQAIPCYRYSFEPNGQAVETILNFRD